MIDKLLSIATGKLRQYADNWMTTLLGVTALLVALGGGIEYLLVAPEVTSDGIGAYVESVKDAIALITGAAGVAMIEARDGSPPLTAQGRRWRAQRNSIANR